MNETKILFATTEVYPFSKAGGLGDTSLALPKVLRKMKVDIRVISPKYKCIDQELINSLAYITKYDVELGDKTVECSLWVTDYQGVPIYFLGNSYYFGRDKIYGYSDETEQFLFFDKAVLAALPLIQFCPDIIQCNDWFCGTIPLLLKTKYQTSAFYKEIKTLLMIHNIHSHGIGSQDLYQWLELDRDFIINNHLNEGGPLNFKKSAAVFADEIATVSPTHAKEINNLRAEGQPYHEFFKKYPNDLNGILCGIDTEQYNPATDREIFKNFSAEHPEGKKVNKIMLQQMLGLPVREDIPLICWVSRLDRQKGIDLIGGMIEHLIEEDAQYVITGNGEACYEKLFNEFSEKYPTKFRYIKFDETMAHRIYAGSDMFILPSRYEPCGLSQQISMCYGTVPIVRATGGLADTVTEFDKETSVGTGFLFKPYNPWAFIHAIRKALTCYREKNVWEIIVSNCMHRDCSWEALVDEYLAFYGKIASKNLLINKGVKGN